jgi:hypothetical protein
MTPEPNPRDELQSKVESYLRQSKLGYEVKSDGRLWVRQGSTILVIDAAQAGDHTVVRLGAPVALNITKISLELTRFLLEKNYLLLFGKFSLDTEENAIWYEHTLLGDALGAQELLVAMAMIALIADEFDEQVSEMAGGQRVTDLHSR